MSVCCHMSKTAHPNFTVCFLAVAILCTSGLVDDVTFAYNWPSKGNPDRAYTQSGSLVDKSLMSVISFLIGSEIQHTTTTVLRPFVRDYPGEPVPEETLTHPPSWSSSNLYQLLPSTTIHSILPVQITCLAIFSHNLSPCLSISYY